MNTTLIIEERDLDVPIGTPKPDGLAIDRAEQSSDRKESSVPIRSNTKGKIVVGIEFGVNIEERLTGGFTRPPQTCTK